MTRTPCQEKTLLGAHEDMACRGHLINACHEFHKQEVNKTVDWVSKLPESTELLCFDFFHL